MRRLFIPMVLFCGGTAFAGTANDGLAIGKRLMAAIKGTTPFEQADFAKPLAESSMAELRRFAACKTTDVHYTLLPHPRRQNVFVRNFNRVALGFDCPGVPRDTPVGISFELSQGKISHIETHNADLMRTE